MSKWTWGTLLAFVAICGGSYFYLSHRQPSAAPPGDIKPSEDMGVEDFDAGDDGSSGDNSYDMLDDPDASSNGNALPGESGKDEATKDGASAAPVATGSVETIDDEEDAGETVKDPVVIEDNDESVEVVEPQAGAKGAK